MTTSSRRSGKGVVDVLLVLSLCALAVVVGAYLTMPDFERALKALVREGASAIGVG